MTVQVLSAKNPNEDTETPSQPFSCEYLILASLHRLIGMIHGNYVSDSIHLSMLIDGIVFHSYDSCINVT